MKIKLNLYMPLVLAILSILLFVGIVFKNEWQLSHSQSIFVRLQPVDPRSLIQGDYMVLNYDLYWTKQDQEIQTLPQQNKILAYVELDQNRRVIRTSLTKTQQNTQRLWLKNPTQYLRSLYPSSRSFFFAEGLAQCYEQARFAEFKVNDKGQAILASLRGEQLQDLGCKQQQSWWKGQN